MIIKLTRQRRLAGTSPVLLGWFVVCVVAFAVIAFSAFSIKGHLHSEKKSGLGSPPFRETGNHVASFSVDAHVRDNKSAGTATIDLDRKFGRDKPFDESGRGGPESERGHPHSRKGFSPAFRVVSPSHAASDANQAMDRRLEEPDLSPAYVEEMIETWRDRGSGGLVRNFAVQHLERYARESVTRGSWDSDSPEAADLRAALEEAILETGTSVGGAALLALARLSEIDPNVNRTRLGARSAIVLSDVSIPTANRVSAAQACGLLRVHSALPALRAVASDPASPVPLRLAAGRSADEMEPRQNGTGGQSL